MYFLIKDDRKANFNAWKYPIFSFFFLFFKPLGGRSLPPAPPPCGAAPGRLGGTYGTLSVYLNSSFNLSNQGGAGVHVVATTLKFFLFCFALFCFVLFCFVLFLFFVFCFFVCLFCFVLFFLFSVALKRQRKWPRVCKYFFFHILCGHFD